MLEDIEHQITDMAKPYFPTAPSDLLRNLLRELPPTEFVFKQITQETDKAVLEIGYESSRLLVDYTLQSDDEKVCVLKIASLQSVYFTSGTAASTLKISAEANEYFQYTASVDSYRQELANYAKRLRRLVRM